MLCSWQQNLYIDNISKGILKIHSVVCQILTNNFSTMNAGIIRIKVEIYVIKMCIRDSFRVPIARLTAAQAAIKTNSK